PEQVGNDAGPPVSRRGVAAFESSGAVTKGIRSGADSREGAGHFRRGVEGPLWSWSNRRASRRSSEGRGLFPAGDRPHRIDPLATSALVESRFSGRQARRL